MAAVLDEARRLAAAYAAHATVHAVALGGSSASGRYDDQSDLDLYVYADPPLGLAARAAIARTFARYAEVGNQFWEDGDEWIDAESGLHIDVMFRTPGWIQAALVGVLERHEASLGSSTCLWSNVLASSPLYDPQGWYAGLQRQAQRPYPDALARAIIAKHYPILRDRQSAYVLQLERAVSRGDLVSMNHRLAALLASYFDILFALNRTPHPGDKRLLAQAGQLPTVPLGMAGAVTAVLSAPPAEVVARVHALLDGLDASLDLRVQRPVLEVSPRRG